jgi:nuclear transport factor 2 (NTF2) superfamily protein
MSSEEALLRQLYERFNSRDMETVLAALHPHVLWANGMEGGHEHGRDAVRAYWTRQWTTLDPHVDPLTFSSTPEGAIAVEVHQVVHDINGNLLVNQIVGHVFQIEDGLVRRFDIRSG